MKFALAVVLVAASLSAQADVVTAGFATFQMGANPVTGKISRCGLEITVFRMIGTSVHDATASGVNGSMYVGRAGPEQYYASTKMALIRKGASDTKHKTTEARTWWIKAPNKPAAVPINKMIPAENPPYNLAGASVESMMDVLSAVLENKELTIYVEPAVGGGADTLTAVLEVEGDGKSKLVGCIKELMG